MKISYHFLKAVLFIFHIYICYVPEMTFGVGCEMGQVSFFFIWLSYQPHIEKIPLASVSAAFITNQGSVYVRISVLFGSPSCTLSLCVCTCAGATQPLQIHHRLQIHHKFDVQQNVFSFVLVLHQEFLAIFIHLHFIYILDSVCQVPPKNPAGILIRTALMTLRRL